MTPRAHLKGDLLLLLTAMIWGSAFVAQKVGMDHIGPFMYTGIRFALGAMFLTPIMLFFSR
ncbi:MAG: EamA family transporter, partial [Desulfosalsimonas sp.]